MKKLLLIIDPQNDFVDPSGSLYVKGSEKSIQKLADYIRDCSSNDSIYRIVVSQDLHNKLNVGFSEFWRDSPKLFTKITAEDIRQKKYIPLNMTVDTEEIAKHLEERGQVITIWPHHCMEDTWGSELAKDISSALGRWIYIKNRNDDSKFSILTKGIGVHEAYSILDSCRPIFGKKPGFEELLDTVTTEKIDVIEICGFCTDVCVKHSTHDLIAGLIGRYNLGITVPEKLVFLPDYSKAIGDDSIANAEIEAMVDSYNSIF